MGEKVQGIRSLCGRYKIDRGRLFSIGNGEAKELICTTHGHELRMVDCWREDGYRTEGCKGGKFRQL